MYESHPRIETPDDDTVIWRYLDIPKFLSLVADRALYFCRVDQFVDKWEGWYTLQQVAQHPDAELTPKRLDWVRWLLRESIKSRATTFASCWHCRPEEHAAMWEIYAARESGVAIRSTIGNLKAALALKKLAVYLGRVIYRPFSLPEKIDRLNMLTPFFLKRKEYFFEEEVRALVSIEPLQMQVTNGRDLIVPEDAKGISYPIDLEKLVHSVIISPHAGQHVLNLVCSVLTQYGFEKIPVLKSSMAESPPSLDEWYSKEPRILSLNLDLPLAGVEALLQACSEFNSYDKTGDARWIANYLLGAVGNAAEQAGYPFQNPFALP